MSRPTPAPGAAGASASLAKLDLERAQQVCDQSDLFLLSNTVAVAAFAAEAWRTLSEIDAVCGYDKQLDQRLSEAVFARRQWSSEINGQSPISAIASVLADVSQRLRDMAEREDVLGAPPGGDVGQ